MAGAKNAVVTGDYSNCYIGCADNQLYIKTGADRIILDRDTVSAYEVVTDEKGKSVSSAIIRGAVGGLLFHVVGLVGGVLLAKDDHIYKIAIDFQGGGRSLIEIDERRYRALVESCFR